MRQKLQAYYGHMNAQNFQQMKQRVVRPYDEWLQMRKIYENNYNLNDRFNVGVSET
jgi:hypothetical protein